MDTTAHQLFETFQTIIETQSSTYNTLFFVFIGVTILIVGSSLFVNFVIYERKMRSEIQNTFNEERKKFYKEIDIRIDQKFETVRKKLNRSTISTRAELAKLFAIYTSELKKYGTASNWATTALKCYIFLEDAKFIRIMMDFLLNTLNNEMWMEQITPQEVDLEEIKSVAEKIPDLLEDERNLILEKLKEAQSEDNTS